MDFVFLDRCFLSETQLDPVMNDTVIVFAVENLPVTPEFSGQMALQTSF